VSNRFKEVVGVVDNVIALEKDSFEALMHTHNKEGGLFTIEKAVKLNLKDYKEGKSVTILKVSREGKTSLLISELLNYQSHVPF
jgi:hypothetical protein